MYMSINGIVLPFLGAILESYLSVSKECFVQHKIKNPWNRFQAENAKQGLSKADMRVRYYLHNKVIGKVVYDKEEHFRRLGSFMKAQNKI